MKTGRGRAANFNEKMFRLFKLAVIDIDGLPFLNWSLWMISEIKRRRGRGEDPISFIIK